MTLAKRSIVSIDDLTNEEIEAIFALADKMADKLHEQFSVCTGHILASLFYEPSTRTRLSFEAAMHRLGGRVITSAELETSSMAKGESIADTVRVISSYADIIVLRHPWEGAAKIAADYATVPVINAGDGGREHPTQTLCDLYTLKKEKGTIKGLTIALCGDLKYGRTVHSLLYALARFGANIICVPAPGLEMPEHVLRKVESDYKAVPKKARLAELESLIKTVDSLYITPDRPHQLALFTDVEGQKKLLKKDRIDALYMTRMQKERLSSTGLAPGTKEDYPTVDERFLSTPHFKDTLVMHPLPRIDELAYEIDDDPRSMYFKQAARGVPIRMALISLLLERKSFELKQENSNQPTRSVYRTYRATGGVSCANEKCVAVKEKHYITPEFDILSEQPLLLRCIYCGHELRPSFVASLRKKKYHKNEGFHTKSIKRENLAVFNSEEEAKKSGFEACEKIETGG